MAKNAEIAGAGLGGLATAIALMDRGWTVRVHERNAELREMGAGIYLSGNGLRVLDALGIKDSVEAGAMQPPVAMVRLNGAIKSKEEINGVSGSPIWTMTRQHLYDCLLKRARALGVEILTNSPIASVDPKGALIDASGARYAADLVVGADGVGSTVRTALNFELDRRYYDDGIVRVLANRSQYGDLDAEWIVDHFSTVGDRKLRVLCTPVSPTQTYLALMADAKVGEANQIPLNIALWKTGFPSLSALLDNLETEGRFDVYQSVMVDRWTKGKVALLGDAAHGMPPTLGQGAGFAMMNGLALSVFVSSTPDVAAALVEWEASERPFTEKTQRKAIEVASLRDQRVNLDLTGPMRESAQHISTGMV